MQKASIPSKSNDKGETIQPQTIHEQTGFCVRNQKTGLEILDENEVQMYIHGRAFFTENSV